MHNASIDLNLLIIFEAVMLELNVTRAAERLNLTQPAVSHALRRLRRLTNDELFVKVPHGVSPTPKALELWDSIGVGLTHIRQALLPASFDPAMATHTFTLALVENLVSLLLTKLVPRFEKLAPNIDLRIFPNTNHNASSLLEKAEVDLAIGRLPEPTTSRLRTHNLFTAEYVCLMRKGHPLASKKLTLNQYANAKHLLVSLTGEATGFIDRALQQQGLKRRIALTVNQFTPVPQLIATSDLLTVLPAWNVQTSDFKEQLHIVPVPLKIAPLTVQMMWHERKQNDPAHEWLRSQVIEVCANFRNS
jgi:DNA-binding transcriptional LysR family regulator